MDLYICTRSHDTGVNPRVGQRFFKKKEKVWSVKTTVLGIKLSA